MSSIVFDRCVYEFFFLFRYFDVGQERVGKFKGKCTRNRIRGGKRAHATRSANADPVDGFLFFFPPESSTFRNRYLYNCTLGPVTISFQRSPIER